MRVKVRSTDAAPPRLKNSPALAALLRDGDQESVPAIEVARQALDRQAMQRMKVETGSGDTVELARFPAPVARAAAAQSVVHAAGA